MSYKALYRSYRPQTFGEVAGQEHIVTTLKNAIKENRISHAYLFAGPRGTGKTTVAKLLAKALNCTGENPPCDQCPNCKAITVGEHPDVIEIDAASNNGVDEVRDLIDKVKYAPINGKYKVYIIDEVHMLSTSAFNALLKTIEEPPAHVIFIFATTELQKVPATIKSRCQQFNFRLVSIEKVKQCLAEAAAELNIQADDEALFWIARESTGSMRDAYTLFDQVVAFSDGHITYEKIRDKLGLLGLDRLNTIFEACANGKTEDVLNMLDEFLQGGISIEQFISNCADYLRALLLIKSGVTKESLLGNTAERYSQIVLASWNPIQIERALSIYLQLYRDIRYSLSPRYELELAFSRLCWISQYVSNMEVKKAIDAAQALLMPAMNTASGAQGSAPSSLSVGSTNGAPVNASMGSPMGTSIGAMGSVGAMGMPTSAPVSGQSFSEGQNTFSQIGQPSQTAQDNQNNQNNRINGVNPIPNGLPKLSMLEENADNFQQNSGESFGGGDESHPFYNGGSLPPEQTVMADDDWSNTETPPDDDYYEPVEQDYQAMADEYSEEYSQPEPNNQNMNSSNMYMNASAVTDNAYANANGTNGMNFQNGNGVGSGQNQNNIGSAPVQLSDTFTTADGRTMSVAQLRGNITATLSIDNGFIVSVLEKTGLWVLKDDKIETTVPTQLDLSILNKNLQLLGNEISKICGKQMSFSVTLQETVNENTPAKREIPQQVRNIVDIFRGTLV